MASSEIGAAEPSPWLGGIDIDHFDGDGVAAAASIDGVVAYSPVAIHPDLIGVDGIITDHPDMLRGLLAERGMELPRRFAREG